MACGVRPVAAAPGLPSRARAAGRGRTSDDSLCRTVAASKEDTVSE